MTGMDSDSAGRELQSQLSALARASRREAPAAVEAALLAEFRGRRFQPQAARRLRWYWIAGLAAACLVAAVGIRARKNAPGPAPRVAVTTPVATQAVPRAPSPANRPLARRTVPRRAPADTAAVPRPIRPEIATGFIPVSYAVPPVEQGSVVRVRMPRSALLSFGLPMNFDRADEPVQADVLLGEDGVARAIRFVR